MTDSVSTRADGSRRRRLQRRLKCARGRSGRVFGTDLLLLHAPLVWDFREEVILQSRDLADLAGLVRQTRPGDLAQRK